MGGRPLKWATPDHLRKAGEKYFADCAKKKEQVCITGLAVALGASRQLLLDYAERDGYGEVIIDFKMRVEYAYEMGLLSGKNSAGYIFAMKNFGWKDRTEVAQEHSFTQMGRVEVRDADGVVVPGFKLDFDVGKSVTEG